MDVPSFKHIFDLQGSSGIICVSAMKAFCIPGCILLYTLAYIENINNIKNVEDVYLVAFPDVIM